MTAPWPDHLLSLDDWDALSPDPLHRYELVEGLLLVAPRPAFLHQRAMFRLAAELEMQLPLELSAATEIEILIESSGPTTVRVPDVIVVPTAVANANPARVDAADVLLAVEITSPGTVRTDRITKLYEYADAGIPAYWLLDVTPPPTMTAHALVDGDYEIVGDGGGVLSLLSPAPVTIDLSRLTDR